MQITNVPTVVTAPAELRVIGSAAAPLDPPAGQPRPPRFDVLEGQTLRTGVTDIARAGHELLREYWDGKDGGSVAGGLVGFLRTGETWKAVELLTRDANGAIARPDLVSRLTAAPGVQIDAAWLMSDFGGDYSTRVLSRPSN